MSEPIVLVCQGCRLSYGDCPCQPVARTINPPLCGCGRPLVKKRSGVVGLDVATLVGAPRAELPAGMADACGSLHRCDSCEFETDDVGALLMHMLDAHPPDDGQPRRVSVSVAPRWLAPPVICAACDVAGATAVTGRLQWHAAPLVHEHLQALVMVPLHASCTHEHGIREALTRLGVALTMSLLKVGVPHGG
ncbi:hypothetical protein NR798_24210 [Archangium gephyra]|uniref:hypothetical protein n=1 Tax=Archangium gephyra TaxID=48 RepID=UPI0035D4B436